MSDLVVLVRHAETEWSRAGRHTGRTDVPLTDAGREHARTLAGALAEDEFELVLVSPLARARETCELAGFGARALVRDDLAEWDYGAYEGLTTAQILAQRPDWNLWRDGCPDGESPLEVGARADRVVAELETCSGRAIVFSHGHALRVLGARWTGMDPGWGGALGLSTGGICKLSHEHGRQILAGWNLAP